MKKLTLLLLAIGLSSVAWAQGVKFSSDKPQTGKALSFEFNPIGTKLENDTIKSMVLVSDIDNGFAMKSIALKKEGNKYKGEIAGENLDFAMLVLSSTNKKDVAPISYYTLYYNNGKTIPTGYIAEAKLLGGMGRGIMELDNAKALVSYQKAFAADASLKNKYISGYLSTQLSKDEVKGRQMIKDNILRIEALAKPTEDNLTMLAALYKVDKQKDKADEISNKILTQYPTGNLAYNKGSNQIYMAKNGLIAEQMLNKLISDFKLDRTKPADENKLKMFDSRMALLHGMDGNEQKFELYASKINNKANLASLYNQVAWPMAEKKANVDFASKLSKKSLELIDEVKKTTKNEAEIKNLNRAWDMYADTYALLLHHQGNSKEAVAYQEKVLANADVEGRERYVTFLLADKQTDRAYVTAEDFIKKGQATDSVKTLFKTLYENKGNKDFDTYLASLTKEADEAEKAKILKEMTNNPAPAFALMNLKGEKVDLAAQKGKVVILDYWATWCGPCVASFPGMQKAVEKYKNDAKVVFLFINTWQREDNREKVVKDFFVDKPYTFNVLLDTKSKADPEKFEIVDKYKVTGIPTKFIIDGNGNIRFTKVGSSAYADATVKELDVMIALAKD